MKISFDLLREHLVGRGCEIPLNQVNTHLPDEMVMRVGIPHRGGKLAIHAFESDYPAMVSANAFFNQKTQRFDLPQVSPLEDMDVALDSAGFVAIQNFKAKGPQRGAGTIFPWQLADYLELAALMRPTWYSAMDLCCEPEASNGGIDTDWRIRATATMLEGMLQILEGWQAEYAKDATATMVANHLKPPVPVIQGWSRENYWRSLDLTMEVWDRHGWLAPPTLMGLGSVCRRDLHHPEYGLFAILDSLEGRLPKGTFLHLFGVKGTALDRVRCYDFVASTDSMAWDVRARRNAFAAGISNTMAHRATVMTEWMQTAQARMRPQPGDQFRLPF